MLILNKRQKRALGDFFVDLAKISFGTIVAGAIIGGKGWGFAVFGIAITIFTLWMGLILLQSEKKPDSLKGDKR